MKKLFYSIIILLTINTHNSYSQSESIKIDITAAERFYDLMNYIESVSKDGIKNKYLSIEQIREIYKENLKDTTRQKLIESLLDTRPYSHEYMNYVKCHGDSAKNAYRIAFNIMGQGITKYMTAGMPKSWANFWNNPQRKRINFDSLKNLGDSIRIDEAKLKNYLPNNGFNNTKFITLYLSIDGNRGAYQEDSIMVFDLIYSPPVIDDSFIATLSHELHHIYYEDWIKCNYIGTPLDSNFKKHQISFILEGVAQYMNFDLYPKRTQKLYSNRKLLKELHDDLLCGKYEYNYKLERKRLHKYIILPTKKEYSLRPTLLYYLSYNTYKSIEKAGGKKMLDYVIENPKELVSIYNELYNVKDMLFPRFPKEFENAWRANF